MADRLNDLAYLQHISAPAPSVSSMHPNHHPSSYPQHPQQQQHFNPRTVPLEIRTPEELAAVNEFLVNLGRDIAAPPPSSSHPSHHHPNRGEYRSSPPVNANGNGASYLHPQHQRGSPSEEEYQSFFDAAALQSLGLAGMPGVPVPSSSSVGLSPDSGYTSTPSSYGRGGMYPSIGSEGHYPDRRISNPNPNPNSGYGAGGSGNRSPYAHSHSGSGASTPPAGYPHAISEPQTFDFDMLRAPRGPGPSAHLGVGMAGLGAGVYGRGLGGGGGGAGLGGVGGGAGRHVQTIVALKSSGLAQHLEPLSSDSESDGSEEEEVEEEEESTKEKTATATTKQKRRRTPPSPVEPPLRTTLHPGPPAQLTSASAFPPAPGRLGGSSLGSRRSLYPSLEGGGIRLPPLKEILPPSPSPSPEPSTRSTSTRGGTPQSPLPRLRNLLPHHRANSFGEDSLVRGVGRIALSAREERERETRRRHALLVKDLLVGINEDYKRRFGDPSVGVKAQVKVEAEAGRDVEMGVA